MTKNGRKKTGYFTISDEISIDVDIYDVIRNLDMFSEEDLNELRDSINNQIDENINVSYFQVNTIEDEYKMKILKELFKKYTWEELEKIKISS
jgi:septin family protein